MILFFSKKCKSAPQPTYPPIKWVLGDKGRLSAVKAARPTADYSPHLVTTLGMSGATLLRTHTHNFIACTETILLLTIIVGCEYLARWTEKKTEFRFQVTFK